MRRKKLEIIIKDDIVKAPYFLRGKTNENVLWWGVYEQGYVRRGGNILSNKIRIL